MKINAAISYAPREPLRIEEVELSEDLRAHEILVRNVAAGICHSDLSLRDAPPEIRFMPKPAIFGHEGSGIVERVGSGVTALEPGDHVVMSYVYDGTCHQCEQGLHAYCDNFFAYNLRGTRLDGSPAVTSPNHERITGSYHQQSSFATFSIATDINAIKVPKELPLEYLGPIGCGFLTGAGAIRNRMKPRPGSSFVAFGIGAVGFGAIHMARKMGCETIIAVDLHQSRLDLARTFGATHLINASEVPDTRAAIYAIQKGGVDYAFEATGNAAVMGTAIDSLRHGGTCLLAGVVFDSARKTEFTPAWFMTDKTVTGIMMGHADMPGTIEELVEDVRSGTFPVEKLVTIYDFADINRAIEDAESGVAIKAIVRMP
ncbi:NAD(P)-dependent alcohol dehydrogenase [Nocardia sp. NPDC005366]|uniref:NAD(P)-dependent alcohol dehydrogenase n=1 Tax=Nocardia sp. NPDC005366 TaxID=3156878 RepID=UPI0033B34237